MTTPIVGHNIKWLSAVSVWLFMLMSVALTSGKVSLLWLLRLYKYEQIHPAAWYILICAMLLFPHVTNLIYIIWNTPFISSANKKTMSSPGHIYLGILDVVIETVAVCVFASEIAIVLPEPVFLFLPSAVYAIPLIVKTAHTMKMKRKQASNRLVRAVTQCVQVFLCTYTFWAPSIVSAFIYLWSSFNMQLRHCIALPIIMIVLSFSWSPRVQEMIVCSLPSGQRNWKASLSYCCLRIAAIPVTLTGLMALNIESFRDNMADFLITGLLDLADNRVWLPALVTFIAGMAALSIMNAASKVSLTTPGVWLPSFLAPVMTYAAATLLWGDVSTEAIWELSGVDLVTWAASGMAFLIWTIPYTIPSISIIESPTALLRPFSENFFGFVWNIMFLEQSLILNYNHRGIGMKERLAKTTIKQGKHKTVFVCTTMFRETEAEMKRYLVSLHKMMSSELLNDVSLEAHILLDNAIVKDQFNPFAYQLLNLLVDVFQLSYSELHNYKTPYGFQLRCLYAEHFPIYVHVKNGDKFKIKKRWSQVMYMNYILKYRCGFESSSAYGQDLNAKLSPTVKASSEEIDFSMKNTEMFDSPIRGLKYTGKRDYHNSVYQYFTNNAKDNSQSHVSSSTEDNYDDTGSETSTEVSEAYTVSRESASYLTSEGTDSDDSDFLMYIRRNLNTQRTLPSPSGESDLVKNVLKAELAKQDGGVGGSARRMYTPSDLFYFQPGGPTPAKWRARQDIRPIAEDAAAKSPVFTITGSRCLSKHEDVYVLATDADTQFKAKSVRALLDLCDRDQSLGAACGRTVPTGGSKPVVWYQKFEYAKDFWLVKASQNIIGSVTCCPGCFSLYRGQALADVMDTFSEPSLSGFDALVKDHGEDRWLCTLMMVRGWKLEYTNSCRNSTHCPESFTEFMRQRRRWVLSELSNMVIILQSLAELVRRNSAFSVVFILSLVQMFLWVLLSPSTTLLILCVACEIIFGVPVVWTAPVAFASLLSYTVICCACGSRTQNNATLTFLLVIAALMMAISAGFVAYMFITIKEDWLDGHIEFRPVFLVPILISGTIYAALIHPGESFNLVYGVVYAFIFPAMFIILPVYAVCNIVDQSWGTREKNTTGENCCDRNSSYESPDKEISPAISLKAKATSPLPSVAETRFWENLGKTLLGKNVNCGESEDSLRHNLKNLRDKSVVIMVGMNSVWYALLTSIYLVANSDVVCYIFAGVFSFSLVVQLVGLTSYKIDSCLRRHIVRRAGLSHPLWVKDRH